MSTLGLDPAKKTGWAYRDGDYWRFGTLDPTDRDAVIDVVWAAKKAGCTHAYVEDCHVPGHGNIRTVKSLQESQTRLVVACEMAGLRVVKVQPATWRQGFSLTGKRAELKRAAKIIAQQLGAPIKTNDEAEAVLISEYGSCAVRRERLAMRRGA